MSGKRTVLCNEGGAYTIYESDERGFNNPKGIWSRAPGSFEIGIVGEAFMQGACVPAGRSAADVIRAGHRNTVNLGVGGNGPLLDLAGIVEYFTEIQPRFVVWSYYHNDLSALEAEKKSPILRGYLDGCVRSQGLSLRQAAIDEALANVARREEASARTWPAALATVGVTRVRAPVWMSDLIMGEQHSTAGAALRLDKLSGFVGARVGARRPEVAPDVVTLQRALERAKTTVRGWGGELVFIYLADLHHLRGPEHPTRRAVLDAVRAAGVTVIDLQPVFAALPDPMIARYHAESHLNEEGQQIVGRAVLGALQRLRRGW
ncbi:Hypothetical protein A7982_09821 [Minicystis rosea]|nr:Hypothetical protein A7982_09821 [Minicystis rosea]